MEGLSSSTDVRLDRLASFLWCHGARAVCCCLLGCLLLPAGLLRPCASRVVRACCASPCSHADLWVHLKFTCTYSGIFVFHPDVLRGSGVIMMLLAMSMGVVVQMNAIFGP